MEKLMCKLEIVMPEEYYERFRAVLLRYEGTIKSKKTLNNVSRKETPGQVLKRCMKISSLSQRTISKATGVSVSTLSGIQNDKISAGEKSAGKLARFFGVDKELFMTQTNKGNPTC